MPGFRFFSFELMGIFIFFVHPKNLTIKNKTKWQIKLIIQGKKVIALCMLYSSFWQ